MAINYQAISNDVVGALKEAGRLVTLKQMIGGDINKATGEITTAEFEASEELYAAGPFSYDNSKIDGQNILQNDGYIVMETPSDLTPGPSMVVDIDGTDWQIVNAQPIQATDVVVAYKLQLRIG